MIDMHIRPGEVLRCESRPPRRELGLLRWSLAATLVLAAALDALWLVPVPVSRPVAQRVEAPRPEPRRSGRPKRERFTGVASSAGFSTTTLRFCHAANKKTFRPSITT